MPPTGNEPDIVKAVIDGFSVLTLLGWAVGALPAIATLLTIVWTAIRVYETKTVQNLIKRLRKRK